MDRFSIFYNSSFDILALTGNAKKKKKKELGTLDFRTKMRMCLRLGKAGAVCSGESTVIPSPFWVLTI